MRSEEVLDLLRRQPFEPFRVRLSTSEPLQTARSIVPDGRSLVMQAPLTLARPLFVYDDLHMIDVGIEAPRTEGGDHCHAI